MPDREVYVAQSVVTVGDRGVAVAVMLIARFDGDVDHDLFHAAPVAAKPYEIGVLF